MPRPTELTGTQEVALAELRDARVQLEKAKRQYDRALVKARRKNCSLREMGEAAGIANTSILASLRRIERETGVSA